MSAGSTLALGSSKFGFGITEKQVAQKLKKVRYSSVTTEEEKIVYE